MKVLGTNGVGVVAQKVAEEEAVVVMWGVKYNSCELRCPSEPRKNGVKDGC